MQYRGLSNMLIMGTSLFGMPRVTTLDKLFNHAGLIMPQV